MIGLFSSIGEHVPIFKREKQMEASSEGYVNRMHYRATCLLILGNKAEHQKLTIFIFFSIHNVESVSPVTD